MILGAGALAAAASIMKKCDSFNLPPEAISRGLDEKRDRLHKKPARLRATKEQIANIASHNQRAQDVDVRLNSIEKLLENTSKPIVIISSITICVLILLFSALFLNHVFPILLFILWFLGIFGLYNLLVNVYANIVVKKVIIEQKLKRQLDKEYRESLEEYFEEMCQFYEERRAYYDQKNKYYAMRTQMYEKKLASYLQSQ